MLNKKISIMLLVSILLFVFSANVFAVPPHPSVVKSFEERGELYKLQEKMEAMQKRLNLRPEKNIRFPSKTIVNDLSKANEGNEAALSISAVILIMGVGASILLGKKKGIGNITTLLSIFLLIVVPMGIFIHSCEPPVDPDPDESATKVLIILMNYSDYSFNASNTSSFYDSLFTDGPGGNGFGWKQYYKDMSNGELNLEFDVYGPYTASNTHNYYGHNTGDYDDYPATLAGEAVDAAEAAGVDFSKYDSDNDGNVDIVTVVHQGQGEEVGASSTDIWSHQWYLSSGQAYGDGSGARTYDGVSIDMYTMQPEYIVTPGDSTVGVFAHEFGHGLGLPDLYDYSGDTNGVGYWSIMAAGSWGGTNGDRPSPMLAWERNKLEWLTYTNIQSGSNSVGDIETSYNAIKVPLGDTGGQEYLLIENKVISFNSLDWTHSLPADGLLVVHLDDEILLNSSDYWYCNTSSGTLANSQYRNGVVIAEADHESDYTTNGNLMTTPPSNGGDSSDTYHSAGNTGIATIPHIDGGAGEDVSISSISAKSSTMTFNH